ncbi:hypothetical protein AVEN_107875-1, partial [Araneus ventricosus]
VTKLLESSQLFFRNHNMILTNNLDPFIPFERILDDEDVIVTGRKLTGREIRENLAGSFDVDETERNEKQQISKSWERRQG